MTAYPDEHPVRLIHGAGTKAERVENLPLHAIDRSPHLGLLSSLYVTPQSATTSFETFQEIIARLRAPDGCPWDREQTHLSLRPFLLEETYEALDALDRGDMTDLAEELGDLLLQIVLHAQIATEEEDFNIHEVIDGVGQKLIRRHPHVFSEVEVSGVSGVVRNWEAIKAEERRETKGSPKTGLLDGVPSSLPALSQAGAIIERVGRVDFNLLISQGSPQSICQKLDKLAEEGEKLEVIGELLLAVSALAFRYGVDAESALRERLTDFRTRFTWMQTKAADLGKTLGDLTKKEQAILWMQSDNAFVAEEDV
jgi:tetrapyrrole methylase family protein/MazG family protein